jgi:Domain of unknown function (DUF5666)
MMKTKILYALFLALAMATVSAAQTPSSPQEPADAPPQASRGGRGFRGAMFNGQRQMGTITAIDGDKWTLQTEGDKPLVVKIDGQTRFLKDRQPVTAGDFKVGDRVMVAGEAQDKDKNDKSEFSARVVASFSGAARQQVAEGMGKQFIAGEVKGIDGTKLTVLRPDGETQVIEADENTSFRKMRESITLADIKPGDQIFGRGELKNGAFVPSRLDVMDPQQMRDRQMRGPQQMRNLGRGQPPAAAPPAE